MKNKEIERRIKLSKATPKDRRYDPKTGMVVYHRYDLTDPPKLTFWDDCATYIGSQKVLILWQHPRQVYETISNAHAWKEVPEEQTAREMYDEMFSPETANYAKVGNSRKKIVSYTMAPLSQEWQDKHTHRKEVQQNIMLNGDVEVLPSFTVTQKDYCRCVEIVAPIEVRNEDDLASLVTLVKTLLKLRTNIVDVFPGYVYNKQSYRNENKGNE